MQSMADKAWQTAADCARRAEQTYDPTVRDLHRRMRDPWIAVANCCEFLDDAGLTRSQPRRFTDKLIELVETIRR